MKYFTAEWHYGDLTDEETEDVQRSYLAHVANIAPSLPPQLRDLAAGEPNLHDASVRRVILDTESGALRLELAGWDSARGHQLNLELAYEGVTIDTLDIPTLMQVAQDPESVVLYDEIDVIDDSSFTHRILFWGRRRRRRRRQPGYYHEIEIVFRSLSVARSAKLAQEGTAVMGPPPLPRDRFVFLSATDFTDRGMRDRLQ